jgi:predicted phosphate transport protein (TIGR00153 family)
VRFRITPVDTTFYDLFAKSAGHLVEGARLLAEMLADGNDRVETARAMKDAEHRCDEVTHEIIRRVNSTFVTPFDREDIYRLSSNLDDVMDDMEAAVDYVYLYEIDALPQGVEDQVEVLQRAADLTADAMPRLRTMRDLEEYWIEVNRLENLGDQIYRRILAKLFSGSYDALTVMKLKDVVEQLEFAIDSFEKVANTVEQIAVKES